MRALHRYNAPLSDSTPIQASVMELVDMTDSKSVASNGVAVQVRPLVPSLFLPMKEITINRLKVGFFVSDY